MTRNDRLLVKTKRQSGISHFYLCYLASRNTTQVSLPAYNG